MKYTTTIEFKSEPEFYTKESSGIKNNTIRMVNADEDKKILSVLDDIKFIRIINTDNRISTDSFVRSLTDITRYVCKDTLQIIYIFTWDR